MAVYAVLSHLKTRLRGYLKYYDACFDPPSLELARYLYKEVNSFQEFVERLDSSSRKRMSASLARIAEAIPIFRDLFSRHWSDQYNKDEDRKNRMLIRLGLPVEEEENQVLFPIELLDDEEEEEENQVLFPIELLDDEEEENQVLFPIELLDDDEEDQGEEDGENQLPLPIDLPEENEEEEESNRMSRLIDLRDIKRNIHSFIQSLKKVQEEFKEEDNESSSRIHFRRKMVGLSDLYTTLKEDIVRDWREVVKSLSIVGMAGIGKTTLAKEIFGDLDFVEWFDCRAWVAVGREWQLQKILRGIAAQVKPEHTDKMFSIEEEDDDDDDRISEYLKECLKGKRYLIVLDDVWDGQVWYEVNSLLETTIENVGGSRVLLTTRTRKVVDRARLSSGLDSIDMRLLNKEESWDLLREKVFDVESCSFQLERVGRRIAENCHGLPLTIVLVADFLSKSEKTTEYWSEVATLKRHQLFVAAYEEVSKVLYPSYENLPQHLKICFLYMGVFPQNHEIPASNVINLWTAEGLTLEPNTDKSSKKHALICLNELASNSVIVYQKSTKSSSDMSIAKDGIKACGLHSSWWHLCYKEAKKNNFFHVLTSYEDSLAENITGQSRLSIHNNILLGIKEVYDSVEENCASTARSLLFYGPYSPYPIPICSALKLLKVLDAFKIHFYEFPLQVLQLVELKYLALTCDGKLPPSISKLQKLQFLIVRPHQNIRPWGDLFYLPLEIWDIKELKHLQVMGCNLPDFWGTPLPNLLTLLDVSGHSCTKGVFEKIPNLSKLGIRIELPPDHSGEPLSCFDHISNLKELESLKCVIVNPEFTLEFVSPPTLPIFPSYLKKLALSGIGYPWAEMSKIASLENLQVLKLRCDAFQGPKWEIEKNTFPALEYLLIEDCDLEHWKVGAGNFKRLEHLSIKHCYMLNELDWEFDETISWIEVLDCDPIVEKKIKESIWEKGVGALDFSMHYSWNDKPQVMR